jgi:hypothetical protein
MIRQGFVGFWAGMVLAVAVVGSLTSSAVAAPRGPAAASGARATGLRPGTEFSAFAASVLTRPAPAVATDGRVHIAYELVLTNTTRAKLKLDRLQVRDARTHRVLLSLAGRALARDMNPVGGAEATESQPTDDLLRSPFASAAGAQTPGTSVGGSESVIVWLDVRVRSYPAVPKVLVHRLVASFVSTPPGAPASISEELTRVQTVRHRPVVLGSPVGAGDWYASDGCCADNTHHRRGLISINGQLLVPQRYAIDWFRVDSKRRAWVGSPRRLGSYLSFNQPALAAAAGTVVDIKDGLPNNSDIPKPPPIPPIQNTVGNHVILKIGPGMYLLYAHLTPHSLRVHLGQRVRGGKILGLIGTTGNSTTPHLHFQVLTAPTFFPTDSPPFVFDRLRLLGRVTQRIWDDILGLQPTGQLPFKPARHIRVHQRQMPLDREVMSFPRGS